MSFIGNVPAEAYSTVTKDTFSGNGSTTDFTLSLSATTNGVEVFVENVQQEPTTAYTISGTTLSFTAAPTSGTNNIYVIHRGPAVQQVVPPAGIAIDASSVTASGNLSVTGTTTLTDDLNVDSGTLFVDASANRVGIGTSSPDARLTLPASLFTSSETAGMIRWQNPNSTADSCVQGYYVSGSGSDIFLGSNLYINTSGGRTRFNTSEESSAINIRRDGDIHFYAGDNTASAPERMRLDSSGNLKFNSGYGSVATAYGVRAWVRFNGTGTPAIDADGNVSSITDTNTGEYSITLSTALPDANYAMVATAGKVGGAPSASNSTIAMTAEAGNQTTTVMYVKLVTSEGTLVDRDNIMVMAVR